MTSKLLAGASAFALTLAFATGAMANPQNLFSDTNTTAVTSNAASATGDSYSESYNTNQNGVSVQSLSASTVGASLTLEVIPVFSGNATVGGNAQQNAAGIVQASANTGMHAISQQASSIGAVGTINIQ